MSGSAPSASRDTGGHPHASRSQGLLPVRGRVVFHRPKRHVWWILRPPKGIRSPLLSACKYGGRPSAHVSMWMCVFLLVGVSPGQEPPEPGHSTLIPSRDCQTVCPFSSPTRQLPLASVSSPYRQGGSGPDLLGPGPPEWRAPCLGPEGRQGGSRLQESLGSGSGWGHPCLGVLEQRPLEAVGGGRWQAEYPWSLLTSSL